MIILNFKKLHPDAIVPDLGTEDAAALDLYACDSGIIVPKSRRTVGTAICWEPVFDTQAERVALALGNLFTPWLKIEGRSGIAQRNGIDILGGVIDADYRGEIKVLMYNSGDKGFYVEPGMRIAQAVLHLRPRFEVKVVDELSDTKRGAGGFGSTGGMI